MDFSTPAGALWAQQQPRGTCGVRPGPPARRLRGLNQRLEPAAALFEHQTGLQVSFLGGSIPCAHVPAFPFRHPQPRRRESGSDGSKILNSACACPEARTPQRSASSSKMATQSSGNKFHSPLDGKLRGGGLCKRCLCRCCLRRVAAGDDGS